MYMAFARIGNLEAISHPFKMRGHASRNLFHAHPELTSARVFEVNLFVSDDGTDYEKIKGTMKFVVRREKEK